MNSISRVSILSLIIVAAVAAIAQKAPAPNPPAPATPQVVSPKTPYDSAKGQLSVVREAKLQSDADASTAKYQLQMKDLQSQWNVEEQVLLAWIAQVKKDNGWDDTYSYDRVKDQWVHAQPAAAPAAADKK